MQLIRRFFDSFDLFLIRHPRLAVVYGVLAAIALAAAYVAIVAGLKDAILNSPRY